jgi:hypothetical protein
MSSQSLKFVALVFIGTLAFGASLTLNASALNLYLIFYFLIYFAFRPRYLISPLTIIHAYYFIFFILAPTFAQIYSKDSFASFNYHLAFVMIFLTHCTAAFGASFGEFFESGKTMQNYEFNNKLQEIRSLKILIPILFFSSSTLVFFIVILSGGFLYWISAPGDAFLNRAGSGVYVVLSHFQHFC